MVRRRCCFCSWLKVGTLTSTFLVSLGAGPKHGRSRKSRAWGMAPKTSSITTQSSWKGPFLETTRPHGIEDASNHPNNVQHPFPASNEPIFPIAIGNVSGHHLPAQRNFTVFPCPASSVSHFHKPVLSRHLPGLGLEAYSQLYRCPDSHSATGSVFFCFWFAMGCNALYQET